MIQVAHIMPTKYMEKLHSEGVTKKYQMQLAHLVLDSSMYRQVCTKGFLDNIFTILDNSAFELGESIDGELFMEAIEIVKPTEIVLPDILFDPKGSLDLMNGFMRKYGDNLQGISLMAVPHGRNLEEYIKSYKTISSLEYVSTIGIGTIYNETFAHNELLGREYLIDKLVTNNMISTKPHHLLGLGDSGNLELSRLARYDFIRSCDSSAAYVNARSGSIISLSGYKKDKEKVDFSAKFNETTYKLMLENIKVLDKAAQ